MDRKQVFLPLILLTLAATCRASEPKSQLPTILRSSDACFQQRLAAKELRRYLYLRTGHLAGIAVSTDMTKVAGAIVIGVKGQRHLQPYINDAALGRRVEALQPQQYVIKTLAATGGETVLIVGGDALGTLYGAYRFVEHLGVRFYLHGDVVPDSPMQYEPPAWTMPECDETGKPLFELRGLNPWGSHPFGFDRWNADDYKSIIGQLAKMRMNFIGMHCYLTHPYDEPTVWVGTKDDFDGHGKVAAAYPARYYNTLWRGHWGPINAKKTGDYGFGASRLFDRDDWGPDVMTGFCPTPSKPEDCNELFNRVGKQFDEAFSFARLVGVKTCLGTEAPLKKFLPKAVRDRLELQGKDPADPAVIREIYEAIFERIARTHPLDYYWIWTPEGWTWQGNSTGDMQATVDDVKAALAALERVDSPMKLVTCGWVLGPKDDRAAFDKMIPKSITISAISRLIGYEPIDAAFGDIAPSGQNGRRKWAIPWLESDDFLASPQLWVGRTRKDAADALAYQCDGLMGLHWRTRIMGPNASALARAAWSQPWNPAPGTLLPNRPPRFPGKLGPTGPGSPIADTAIGGKTADYPGREVSGTEDDVLYQTCRYDLRGYHLKVPNGKYRVTLKFCEPHFNSAGKRVCDVKLQGKTVLKDFDVFAEVGQFAACDRSFDEIEVGDGWLKLDIVYRKSLPCISAIVVQRDGFAKKINCGGPAWKGFSADVGVRSGTRTWRGGNVPRAMPVGDFYRDWALTSFGPEVAVETAALFEKLDGRVPMPLGGGCPSGSITPDNRPWERVAGDYAFVDRMTALRPKVKGAGSLERFDYWLNTFRYQRALARVQCILGQFEAAIKNVEAEKDAAGKNRMAVRTALPLYRKLVGEYGRAVRLRLAAVTTHGGMATVVNLQQHSRFWPVVIDGPGKRLAAALGGPLPAVLPEEGALPSGDYRGPSRIIVPTVRTSLVVGESLKLKVLVLDEAPPKAAELNWRTMGKGEFSQVPLTHVARGVYTVTLDAKAIGDEDFEYYIHTTAADGKRLYYPATAPRMNHTVVVVRLE